MSAAGHATSGNEQSVVDVCICPTCNKTRSFARQRHATLSAAVGAPLPPLSHLHAQAAYRALRQQQRAYCRTRILGWPPNNVQLPPDQTASSSDASGAPLAPSTSPNPPEPNSPNKAAAAAARAAAAAPAALPVPDAVTAAAKAAAASPAAAAMSPPLLPARPPRPPQVAARKEASRLPTFLPLHDMDDLSGRDPRRWLDLATTQLSAGVAMRVAVSGLEADFKPPFPWPWMPPPVPPSVAVAAVVGTARVGVESEAEAIRRRVLAAERVRRAETWQAGVRQLQEKCTAPHTLAERLVATRRSRGGGSGGGNSSGEDGSVSAGGSGGVGIGGGGGGGAEHAAGSQRWPATCGNPFTSGLERSGEVGMEARCLLLVHSHMSYVCFAGECQRLNPQNEAPRPPAIVQRHAAVLTDALLQYHGIPYPVPYYELLGLAEVLSLMQEAALGLSSSSGGVGGGGGPSARSFPADLYGVPAAVKLTTIVQRIVEAVLAPRFAEAVEGQPAAAAASGGGGGGGGGGDGAVNVLDREASMRRSYWRMLSQHAGALNSFAAGLVVKLHVTLLHQATTDLQPIRRRCVLADATAAAAAREADIARGGGAAAAVADAEQHRYQVALRRQYCELAAAAAASEAATVGQREKQLEQQRKQREQQQRRRGKGQTAGAATAAREGVRLDAQLLKALVRHRTAQLLYLAFVPDHPPPPPPTLATMASRAGDGGAAVADANGGTVAADVGNGQPGTGSTALTAGTAGARAAGLAGPRPGAGRDTPTGSERAPTDEQASGDAERASASASASRPLDSDPNLNSDPEWDSVRKRWLDPHQRLLRAELARVLLAACLEETPDRLKVSGPAQLQLTLAATAATDTLLSLHRMFLRQHGVPRRLAARLFGPGPLSSSAEHQEVLLHVDLVDPKADPDPDLGRDLEPGLDPAAPGAAGGGGTLGDGEGGPHVSITFIPGTRELDLRLMEARRRSIANDTGGSGNGDRRCVMSAIRGDDGGEISGSGGAAAAPGDDSGGNGAAAAAAAPGGDSSGNAAAAAAAAAAPGDDNSGNGGAAAAALGDDSSGNGGGAAAAPGGDSSGNGAAVAAAPGGDSSGNGGGDGDGEAALAEAVAACHPGAVLLGAVEGRGAADAQRWVETQLGSGKLSTVACISRHELAEVIEGLARAQAAARRRGYSLLLLPRLARNAHRYQTLRIGSGVFDGYVEQGTATRQEPGSGSDSERTSSDGDSHGNGGDDDDDEEVEKDVENADGGDGGGGGGVLMVGRMMATVSEGWRSLRRTLLNRALCRLLALGPDQASALFNGLAQPEDNGGGSRDGGGGAAAAAEAESGRAAGGPTLRDGGGGGSGGEGGRTSSFEEGLTEEERECFKLQILHLPPRSSLLIEVLEVPTAELEGALTAGTARARAVTA